MKQKVLLAMSGGVDSAVSADILQKMGYEVTGVTMKLYSEEKGESYACGSLKDINDAKTYAKKMGIEHITLDLSKEYKDRVVDYFVNEYINGRTPNPCSKCNRFLKFEIPEFLPGYDFFATGHYCNIEYNEKTGRYGLRKAIDTKKDQSYFMSFLTQKQMARIIFPTGTARKSDIVKLSPQIGLNVHEKKESQDFKGGPSILGSINSSFGNIVDVDGNKLGEHKGIHYYTIGQRKGLGISSDKPLYVLNLDPLKNEVVLGEEKYLYSNAMLVSNVNCMTILYKAGDEFRAKVKIRAAHQGSNALVKMITDDTSKVIFDAPEKSVTLGQTAAFYDFEDNDRLLGGGIIDAVNL